MTGDPVTTRAEIPIDLSQQAHRRLIGILGLLLPALLYVGAGIRPTDPLPRWGILDSVSAYYYTGAVGIFVGVLFALSLFLLTYQGYRGVIADRVVGRIGGVAALGVALFPTSAPDGLAPIPWWTCAMRTVHYVSAITLFLSFILFAAWLFRKSNVPRGERRPTAKRRRDGVCLACGLLMIGAVLWAGGAGVAHAPIFFPESVAILAFAVSWLVKGEAYQPVLALIRRAKVGRGNP